MSVTWRLSPRQRRRLGTRQPTLSPFEIGLCCALVFAIAAGLTVWCVTALADALP